MKYGLYAAAAGTLTAMHRQDVLSTNLANLNTVGFKPDIATTRRSPVQREITGDPVAPQALLERLGGVVQAASTRTSTTQGRLEGTGNDLDLAIDGDGFFTVRDGAGPDGLRFTRDGRFTLDSDRRLVTVTGGQPVLDIAGQPVTIDGTGPIAIDDDGTVSQGGASLATLRIAAIDPQDVIKAGASMFRPRDAETAAALAAGPPAAGAVRQRMLETSAVDAIGTMTALMSAAKAAQSGIKMMQYHDYLSGQAINVLARV